MTSDIATTSLDQAVFLTVAEREAVDKVDEVLSKTIAKGDPSVALRYVYSLRRSGMVTGLATAKTLYGLQQNWTSFATDDAFEDAVLKETGYAPATTRKYVGVWGALFANETIDEGIKQALMCKPMESLLLLKSAAQEGQLNEEDWEEVAGAHDKQAIRAVVQRVRGQRTSAANALVILWERDGRLRARRGEGRYEECGYLPKDAAGTAADAVRRIVESSGVVER